MSDDLRQRVIVSIVYDKSESSATKREIDEVQKRISELDRRAKEAQPNFTKAMDAIGLGAQAQLTRLQKLEVGFQSFTGKLGAGISAIDNFAKTLAPWNQALELGGKAVKFLGEGLDAAAQKYPEHAKDIEALRGQFAGLKTDVMAAVGVMTVELLRPIRPLEEMERRVDALRRKMRGEGSQGSSGFRGDDEARDFWGAAGGRGTFDESTGVEFFSKLNGQLETYKKRVDDAADAQKKAAIEAARWRAELAALSSKNAKEVTDDLVARLEKEIAVANRPSGVGGIDFEGTLARINGTRGTIEQTQRDAYDLGARMQTSYLESLFGPVDEFNAYAAAFGALEAATTSALNAWISGSESLGTAIKKGIGDALAGLASQLAVEGLKHGAYALGSAAFGDFGGAGRHLAAAGAFSLGAVAAASAAKKLGASAGVESSSSGTSAGAGGGRGASSSSFGNGPNQGAGGERIIVYYGDSHAPDSPRMQQMRDERIVDRVFGPQGAANR